MAALSESDSLKTLPIRFIACIDGASSGVIDTEWSCPTFSSEGTARVTRTVIASHPKMMGIENRRMVRAMNGCSACVATARFLVTRISLGSQERRIPH